MNLKKNTVFWNDVKKDKRGVSVLDFLVRLVMAVIAFVIILTIISRFTRLSQQGVDSYQDLVSIINDDSLGNNERTSMVLYMDYKTAIIGFQKGMEQVTLDERAIIDKPRGACAEGVACICLCRSAFEETKDLKFECKKSMSCSDVNKDLDFEPFSFAVSYGIVGVEDSDINMKGFIFYRGPRMVNEGGITIQDVRDRIVFIGKKDNKISISEEDRDLTVQDISIEGP